MVRILLRAAPVGRVRPNGPVFAFILSIPRRYLRGHIRKMAGSLTEQELYRREALSKLRTMGIEPFPAAEYPVTAHSKDIQSAFRRAAKPA